MREPVKKPKRDNPGRTPAIGRRTTPLSWRLIGSQFRLDDGAWWTVTARPELNFLLLETEDRRCRIYRIKDLLGLEGVAPPMSEPPSEVGS